MQDITQGTTINSTTTVVNSQGTYVNKNDLSWPLIFGFNEYVDSSGNGSLISTINQSYIQNEEATLNSAIVSSKVLSDSVTPTDTLVVTGGYITGNENQSSQQSYFALDLLEGYCYSKTITAAANAVTGVTNGVGCPRRSSLRTRIGLAGCLAGLGLPDGLARLWFWSDRFS